MPIIHSVFLAIMPSDLKQYFAQAVDAGASDVHLLDGEPPAFRVDGSIVVTNEAPVTRRALDLFLSEMLTDAHRARLEALDEVDVAIVLADRRFRVNVYRQRGTIAVAARVIPDTIPSADDIRLEPVIRELAELEDGLILVTGPSGCGKSTTLAVLLELINQSRPARIVTIEDPIEFTFTRAQSLITQREIGVDTKDFATALRSALRQDPNVILLGEMRDRESVETALIAAETGHLVLSTLHTPNAPEAVERVISLFPAERQRYLLAQFAGILRAVVAQQLFPAAKKGRVAAREILLANPAVRTHIREHKLGQLRSVIQTSRKQGMQTMEHAIAQLAADGLIAIDGSA